MKLNCIFLSFSILLGCYVPHKNDADLKIPSPQREEVVQCCFIVCDWDTGFKGYDCQEMKVSECKNLSGRVQKSQKPYTIETYDGAYIEKQ